ncbi:MAG: transposase, partial [Acidaminococcales bacterium]|nr:transposase [Acidaminococcales bacterium]
DELDQQSAIVMDNAAFHRKSKLVPLAEKHGHRPIFLPAHSPELDPIENFLAWLKAKLRRTLANVSCFDDALCYCFKSI